MNSDYQELELTPAQQLVDELFLEDIEQSFVTPIAEELKQLIPNFENMDPIEVEYSVLKLNEPLFGIGDSLNVRNKLIYAGVFLGEEAELTWGDIEIRQYQPRFTGFETKKLRLDLETGEWLSDLEFFFKHEIELFERLPISYRVALLYTYVSSKVIAKDSSEIYEFVVGRMVGTGRTIETARFSVDPLFGNSNLYKGWNIRIRDAKPTAKFMGDLGKHIRNIDSNDGTLRWYQTKDFLFNTLFSKEEAEELLDLGGESMASIAFEDGTLPKKPRKNRRPDPKTELACRYIYELEQKGVVIDARKGGIGYAKIAADLVLKFGDRVRSYEPNTLSRVYRAWKKKNGLA